MDTAIRRKRSHDGQASLRRAELEEQLAELRDQEAELVRAIELVVADEKAQKLSVGQSVPLLGEKLTAEPKDYDLKVKLVGESKKRRSRAFWVDVRKVINALNNIRNLNRVFGVPVHETKWGKEPKHYEHYCSVISKPMDLRTIKSKLGDDEHELQYTAPHEVADDIRLIAENCNKFNTGPQNEGVRKLGENLLQMFEKKWREHAFEGRWQKERAQQQLEVEVCLTVLLCGSQVYIVRQAFSSREPVKQVNYCNFILCRSYKSCKQLPTGGQLRKGATLTGAPLDVCKTCPQGSLSSINLSLGSKRGSCLKRVPASGQRHAVQYSASSQSAHSCSLKRMEWCLCGLMSYRTAFYMAYR